MMRRGRRPTIRGKKLKTRRVTCEATTLSKCCSCPASAADGGAHYAGTGRRKRSYASSRSARSAPLIKWIRMEVDSEEEAPPKPVDVHKRMQRGPVIWCVRCGVYADKTSTKDSRRHARELHRDTGIEEVWKGNFASCGIASGLRWERGYQ